MFPVILERVRLNHMLYVSTGCREVEGRIMCVCWPAGAGGGGERGREGWREAVRGGEGVWAVGRGRSAAQERYNITFCKHCESTVSPHKHPCVMGGGGRLRLSGGLTICVRK